MRSEVRETPCPSRKTVIPGVSVEKFRINRRTRQKSNLVTLVCDFQRVIHLGKITDINPIKKGFLNGMQRIHK
jgi:hypothetical protein